MNALTSPLALSRIRKSMCTALLSAVLSLHSSAEQKSLWVDMGLGTSSVTKNHSVPDREFDPSFATHFGVQIRPKPRWSLAISIVRSDEHVGEWSSDLYLRYGRVIYGGIAEKSYWLVGPRIQANLLPMSIGRLRLLACGGLTYQRSIVRTQGEIDVDSNEVLPPDLNVFSEVNAVLGVEASVLISERTEFWLSWELALGNMPKRRKGEAADQLSIILLGIRQRLF